MNQEYLDLNSNRQIVSSKVDGLGVIALNRPSALNALSLEMIRQIATTLKMWEDDEAVRAVLFVGQGARAFCAGGDIKSFYNAGMEYRRGGVHVQIPSLFFGEEYSLNKQIFSYPKPTIALMDGIVMGGGYGVAGHCRHRIVTENTVFAMPEVSIGFFPDVGSVYHLNQVPQNFGRYLALSGVHIKAGDILSAGLADGYVSSKVCDAFVDRIATKGVDVALAECAEAAPTAEIYDGFVSNGLADVFQSFDVNEICENLASSDAPHACGILEVIHSRAPLSVAVTARHMRNMVGKSFAEVIAADFQVAQRFVAYPDLYEGIRAALIDRDHKPVWEPAHLSAVTGEDVDRYFEASEYVLDDVEIFAS